MASPSSQNLNVLRRRLHLVALMLGEKEDWNAARLADFLKNETQFRDEEASDSDIDADDGFKKAVRLDLQKHIESTFGLAVNKKKGGRKSTFEKIPSDSELLELLKLYVGFVTFDATRNIAFKKLIRSQKHSSLWMLARIHFASVMRTRIRFTYTTNEMKIRDVVMNPYHLVVHAGTIYLVGRRDKDKTVGPYIFDRIENLKILEEGFEEKVPPVESFFSHSFGAFIWNWSDPVKVRLRYDTALENVMKDRFSHLEPEIKSFADHIEMAFLVHDYESVCRELFFYGERVEILGPDEVRDTMVDMLTRSMSVYKDREKRGQG